MNDIQSIKEYKYIINHYEDIVLKFNDPENGGEYQTFEAYCKTVWDISKGYASRLVNSCEVVGNLKSCQLATPLTESQTRPLARLEPDQQREAWQKAVETAPEGKVTVLLARPLPF